MAVSDPYRSDLIAWRGSVSTKLDTIIGLVADHETRLRSVEKRVWGATAVVGAVAFVAGLFAKIPWPH